MKTSVLYFSRKGNTEIAAIYLAQKIDAQLIKLADRTNYNGLVGFLRGGLNATRAKIAEQDSSVYETIAGCERIVLATPVWAGKTTPAINAILENADLTDKQVYVMTTQADPDAKDAPIRKEFYQKKISEKNGRFMELFSLQGSSPGKPPVCKEDLMRQVDKTVKID